jgi:hypothetical protein
MIALKLARLTFGGLDSQHLAASVRAADGADVVRQSRVVALWALYELYRLEVLLASAVASALA